MRVVSVSPRRLLELSTAAASVTICLSELAAKGGAMGRFGCYGAEGSPVTRSSNASNAFQVRVRALGSRSTRVAKW